MAKTNELVLIVKINEDIKAVVKLARSINLLALNAILLSRRGGNVALGFGVIADELRLFSKTLTKNMEALRQLSYASIQTISQYQRHLHVNKLMASAVQHVAQLERLEQAEASPFSAIHLNAERSSTLRKNTLQIYQGLHNLLQEADDTSRFGCVISRALKIEATYGGSFSHMLTQIAADFGLLIDEIPDIIHRLNNNIRGQQ